jgi:hypothetical protein
MEDHEFSTNISQSTIGVEADGSSKADGLETNVLEVEEVEVEEVDGTKMAAPPAFEWLQSRGRTLSRGKRSIRLETSIYILLAIGATAFLGEYD